MAHDRDPGAPKRKLGLSGVALLGAFLTPPLATAQTQQSEFEMPRSYALELVEARNPDLGDDMPRSDPFERQYRRFNVDEGIERGVGGWLEGGINWGLRPFGARLSPHLETRVTTDDIRGDGARAIFTLTLNPIRNEERRR